MESEKHIIERIKEYNYRRIVMASLLFIEHILVPQVLSGFNFLELWL
jgi:hypothetical protein